MFDTPPESSDGGMAEARRVLRRTFGFEDFRPGQEEIVAAMLAGLPVLGIMPTGAGKSLCYQLPAAVLPGLTVVVSPLIALMRDQVAALTHLGIEAGALTSGNSEDENRATFRALSEGRLKLLYVAPERLALPGTETLLSRHQVARIAVDEAHCVSQWGHDFRPEYRMIGHFAEALGRPPLAAFTATADPATQADIAGQLFPEPPTTFLGGFYRPNLTLAVRPKDQPRRQVKDFIAARPGQSGIVYAATRKRSEELAQTLAAGGIPALAYHAGLPGEERAARQARFQREDGLVMVATVAFGMGIDKPDIRFVVHADMPKSVEAYYQEIGRAGRDGLPAETLTLYGLEDMRLRRLQLEESEAPEAIKRTERQRLGALLAFLEAPSCRWQVVRRYFGEAAEPCGHCDVCQGGFEPWDGTVAAQKLLSAVLRTGQRFGQEHLVDVLLGQSSEKVVARGHDKLPTFGVGGELDRKAWRDFVRQAYAADLIATDIGSEGGFRMTEAGRAVLKGQAPFACRRPLAGSERRGARRGAAAPAVDLDEAAQSLLSRLKARRLELARGEQVPAYVIFPDRTLIAMAERRPQSLAAMGEVHGVGEAKLARYGETFLAVIAAESSGPSA